MNRSGFAWLSLCCASAHAQFTEVTRFSLVVEDNGNRNGIIEPEEVALVSVYGDLRDDGANSIGSMGVWNTGAGSGQLGTVEALQSARFDIVAVSNASTGTWSDLALTPSLNLLMQPGVPAPDGGILDVHAYQGCGGPISCPDHRDPIPLWSATWTPAGYEPRTVRLAIASYRGFHQVALRVWFGSQFLIVPDIWDPIDADVSFQVAPSAICYPDCNDDGGLTVADFSCFQDRFVAADPWADCSADGVLTVSDFGCFQTKFVLGCP